MAILSLKIALPTPLRLVFDYLPPVDMADEQAHRLPRGVRVSVPFGKLQQVGVLVGVDPDCELKPERLKRATAVLDTQPLLPADILELCDWAINYYHHPPGEVLQQAFPTALRSGGTLPESGKKGWRITVKGLGCGPKSLLRSPAQKKLLDQLKLQCEISGSQLAALGLSRAIANALIDKELIEACLLPPQAAALPPATTEPPQQLNSDQAKALAQLAASLDRYHCLLLNGVTGSGKTEVYLHIIAQVLRMGGQALVLVPEIGLTPQTIQRFARRFNQPVHALHSGLSNGDKLATWQLASSGQACVVIGTRSALFTPMPKLGLIVVDEEHDLSFKQQDGFRYSARDSAIMRAKLRNIPILLGSATPSLETLFNAAQNRYQNLMLPRRAGNAGKPRTEVVDIRGQDLTAGLANYCGEAIAEQLARGNQVLVFINRRGYAPAVMCQQCGWTANCDHCDISMTLHLSNKRLHCHHCGQQERLPRSCPQCQSTRLLTRGQGTEKLTESLARQLPNYPVLRIDSDNIRGKNALQDILDEVNTGRPCILVGTQILAKGHHFPNVTLVVIVDADSGLYNADFRSVERTGQLLLQVAGRAGRARKPGRVLLQTLQPDQPLLQPLLEQDYDRFADILMQQRRQLGLPPFGFMAMIRVESSAPNEAYQLLRNLAAAVPASGELSRIGPLTAPMARKAGRYRFQFILKSHRRQTLHQHLQLLIDWLTTDRLARKLRWSVDVDPQDMS